jgi:hypothetical protein
MEEVRLSREELHELVWTKPMSELAKAYHISDVGLRKICKRLNVPIPVAGHWQRVKAGRTVKRTALPESSAKDDHIMLNRVEAGENKPVNNQTHFEQIVQEIAQDKRINVKALKKDATLHTLADRAKRALESKEHMVYAGGIRMYRTNSGDIEIKAITSSVINRLCRFFSLLLKAVEIRGYHVEVDGQGTYVVINEQRLKILAREKLKQEPSTDKYSTYDYAATGIATFQLGSYRIKEWTDKTQSLEDQLIQIIARLELQARLDHEAQIKREDYWARLAAEKEAREAPQRRKEQELQDFKKLLALANRWKQTQILREYLDSVKESTTKVHFPSQGDDWLTWAQQKADWYDPTIEAEDEIFSEVDRDAL